MARGPDDDDWFADDAPEEGWPPDVQSEENVAPRADDWLSEASGPERRPTWAPTIDRRIVVVVASLIVLLLVGLAAGGVFSGGSATPPAPASSPTGTTQVTTAATTTLQTPKVPAPATTLNPGATGAQVAVLQRALASLGFSAGKVDGVYGPVTKTAVTRFQRSAGLTADGIFGPVTLRALGSALRGP